jgi:predicted SprT family Zn-dependent metalloprotease
MAKIQSIVKLIEIRWECDCGKNIVDLRASPENTGKTNLYCSQCHSEYTNVDTWHLTESRREIHPRRM